MEERRGESKAREGRGKGRTILVEGSALQDHVLAGDASVTPGAWHELSCTVRAVHLRVVVVVGPNQLLAAFL